MAKFLDSILGRGSSSAAESDYMELDLASFESVSGDASPASMYVRIATITDLKDTPRVKDEIYNGNIVIVDVSRLKMDKITYERVLKDLRAVAHDINGDIVGLGDQKYVILTPMSVKISREKIGGGV
ncbi:cell division protein SepF [Methanogenium organophilum]|uniref:Cell division protein SepF n=1 Tax=Methanogenium organophilum TaxID=2199 RepID=A0A9X9S5Z3_METOG|nr:cell division protein SepF [Methanogenium organophilum]WAI02373.1 cell division protein SepF [Methanogenium organophilum]